MFRIVKAISLILIFSINTANAQIDQCSDHMEFVKGSSKSIMNIITDKNLSEVQIEKRLENLFETLVNNNWMGRFVLGRNWRSLTKTQQDEYLDVYKQYLLATYVPRFREYNGQEIVVKSSKPLRKQDEHLVYVDINSVDSQPIEAAFRVRKTGVCYQVLDIIGEGVSLINTQRQDFGAVYNREGYDGLIKTLSKKSKEIKQASPAL